MSGRQAGERELVFCHACQDEWYKDEHGLVCPACGSEIVEIIDHNTDPRPDHGDHDDHDDHSVHNHPLHDHNPWAGDAPDPDDGDISHVEWTGPGGMRVSRTTMRSNGPPPGIDPFGSIFSSMMGGLGQANRQPGRGNEGSNVTPIRGGATLTFGIGGRNPQMRVIRTGSDDMAMDDLHGIMNNIFTMFGTPAGSRPRGNGVPGGEPNGPPINHMMRMLMDIVPPLSGSAGDVAYTEEAFDRIISALREQNEHSNAPGPASAAAIDALPKVKITKDQQDEDGSADCSICMENVPIDTEVTKLPCSHWFHNDCISSWLKEHDTCPQCRRGITPKDGDQDAPRSTGQAPRYWQVNEGEINDLARQATQGSRSSEGPSRTATNDSQSHRSQPQSPTTGSSSRQGRRENDNGRLGGLAGMFSGMGRRFGGNHDSGGSRNHRD